MLAAPRQLPLPFAHRPDYAAAFLPAPSNAAARAWLARPPGEWPGRRLALYGAAGAGKSHLLHRWATRHGARVLHGSMLAGLPAEPGQALAIDDADALGEERALLHLLNAAAEARWPVLLAAAEPPSRWTVRLPDLASRLRAIAAIAIAPAEDDLLAALLSHLLAARRLAVPPPLQAYLLARLPRSPAALREAAARLDRLALAAGRGVSARLAALVVAEMAAKERGGGFDDEFSVAEEALAAASSRRASLCMEPLL
ncbi:MAG: hypothetical protein KGL12_15245 [Rhodospirillales bacterium]|nr:hypothetical protein [Rhodospirillales bacterium]